MNKEPDIHYYRAILHMLPLGSPIYQQMWERMQEAEEKL